MRRNDRTDRSLTEIISAAPAHIDNAGGLPFMMRGLRPMLPVVKAKLLEGKKGLIVGIANENSIAWGCAKAFRAFGAELAVTYVNDKAKKYVAPRTRDRGADHITARCQCTGPDGGRL